jgi:hypothetical protein
MDAADVELVAYDDLEYVVDSSLLPPNHHDDVDEASLSDHDDHGARDNDHRGVDDDDRSDDHHRSSHDDHCAGDDDHGTGDNDHGTGDNDHDESAATATATAAK